MEHLAAGQIRFRVHSPALAEQGEVDASVFARKLTILVRALQAADKAANNGALAHRFTIAKLHTSTPTAVLRERAIPRRDPGFVSANSGIGAFTECADAIQLGSPRALEFGKTAGYISDLAKGSRNQFGYAEVWTDNDNIVRIDEFMAERAAAVLSPSSSDAASTKVWFKGAVFGTFDGILQVVDTRGSRPEIKLTLTAGGKQVDCVCRADHIETIGGALNKRVRVSGRAIYDGKGGLPRRVEASSIERVPDPGDFSRWKGAFEPFEVSEWEVDEP